MSAARSWNMAIRKPLAFRSYRSSGSTASRGRAIAARARSPYRAVSALPSRFTPHTKEMKWFYTATSQADQWKDSTGTLFKPDGHWEPILQHEHAHGSYHRISQGTSQNERLGNKIVVRKIEYTLLVKYASHSDVSRGGCNNIRLAIIQDTQSNGVVASAAISTPQLFQKESGLDYSILSLRNPIWMPKYRVLKEYIIIPNQTASSVVPTGGTHAHEFAEKDVFFSGVLNTTIPITFQGSTGHPEEVVNNNLYLFVQTDIGPDDTVGEDRTKPTIDFTFMIYYEDD